MNRLSSKNKNGGKLVGDDDDEENEITRLTRTLSNSKIMSPALARSLSNAKLAQRKQLDALAAAAAGKNLTSDPSPTPPDTTRSTHETNEEEDELGIARSSKYHAVDSEQLRIPHPNPQLPPGQVIAQWGGSTDADSHAAFGGIGSIDSLQFIESPAGVGAAAAASSASTNQNPCSVFSPHALLRNGNGPKNHVVNLNVTKNLSVSSSSSSTKGLNLSPAPFTEREARLNADSITSTEQSTNPFELHLSQHQFSSDTLMNEKERMDSFRRAQEKREEALLESKLRGGPLVMDSNPSSSASPLTPVRPRAGYVGAGIGVAGTGYVSASAALAAQAAHAPVQPLKPYVRYVPKYNVAVGGNGQQQTGPAAATTAATITPTSPISAASSQQQQLPKSPEEEKVQSPPSDIARPPSGTPAIRPSSSPRSRPSSSNSGTSLAKIRATTSFSVTGSLHTSVAINLSPEVFPSIANADGTPALASTTTAAGSSSFSSSHTPSTPSHQQQQTMIQHGRRAGSATKQQPRLLPTSPQHQNQQQRTQQEDDAGEFDNTFLTGVNFAESQHHHQRHLSPTHQQHHHHLIPHPNASQIADEIRSSLQRAISEAPPENENLNEMALEVFVNSVSIEEAVSVLSEIMRPTRRSIQRIAQEYERALQEHNKIIQGTSPTPAAKTVRVPLPNLPLLEIPPRVHLDEIMNLALRTLKFPPNASSVASSSSIDNHQQQQNEIMQHSENGEQFAFKHATTSNNGNTMLAIGSMQSVKESTFKSYFYGPESKRIIKDTFYFVLLYFFGSTMSTDRLPQAPSGVPYRLGGPPRFGDLSLGDDIDSDQFNNSTFSHSTAGGDEMYRYRDYATNLKKYKEQEGFAKKYTEWVAECERLKKQERESTQAIGAQIAQGGGGAGTPGTNGTAHQLPSHKEELILPPAPAQSSKAKRAPLVLLADIPPFDAHAKLNTGPIPKGLFHVELQPEQHGGGGHKKSRGKSNVGKHGSWKHPKHPLYPAPASTASSPFVPSYTSPSFLLTSLKNRISTQFVRLFLKVAPQHKDFFYLHFHDLLAQIMFYSFLVAYPHSRPLVNHTFFKTRLLQLTSHWVHGYVSSPDVLNRNSLANWQGDLQFITGDSGLNHKWLNEKHEANLLLLQNRKAIAGGNADGNEDGNDGSSSSSSKKSVNTDADVGGSSNGEDDGSDDGGTDSNHSSSFENGSGSNSSATSTSGRSSSNTATAYVNQLEKKLNAHLAAYSKAAKANRQLAKEQAAAAAAAAHANSTNYSFLHPQVHFSAYTLAGGNSGAPSPSAGGRTRRMAASSTANVPPSGSVTPSSASSPSLHPPPHSQTNEAAANSSSASQLVAAPSTTPTAPPVVVRGGNIGASMSPSLTGDLLIDVGVKSRSVTQRIPLKVTRRKVELLHSNLIGTFINSRNFSSQSRNLTLKIPISFPANTNPTSSSMDPLLSGGTSSSSSSSIAMDNNIADAGAILDHLAIHNQNHARESANLRATYEQAKLAYNQIENRAKKQHYCDYSTYGSNTGGSSSSNPGGSGRKYLNEIDQAHERALRESATFSKNLLQQFQEKKYQSLKAPSKNLALRRLGHFRQTKEGSGALSNSMGTRTESSPTLIKAALMM